MFWLFDGVLHNIEITASHAPSDLVNWCGFDPSSDDILFWCKEQEIELRLVQEAEESQLWAAPSGAQIALQGGRLWNMTLSID